MNTIRLYGSLGREFGAVHKFSIATMNEAIEALLANFPSFFDFIRDKHFRVVVGKSQKTGIELDEAMLPGFRLGRQELHIVPVIKGSKRGGLGKIVAGIALIGLSIATGGSALMATPLWGGATVGSAVGSIGVGMALTGVASLITPEQKAPKDEKSFTMNGPQSNTREGGIVPIAYGEVYTSGTLINGALSIDQKGHSKTDGQNNGNGWTEDFKDTVRNVIGKLTGQVELTGTTKGKM